MDWQLFFRERGEQSGNPLLQQYYQCGCVQDNEELSKLQFVALDFETTGLDPQQDEVISIGLVPFDLNRIRLSEARHWLLKPRRELAESSIVFHGITHDDLTDAPDLSQLLEPLLQAIAGKIVVVHYRYIERDFLNQALKQRIGEGISFPVVDTMELEAMLHRRGFRRLCKRLLGYPDTSIRLADSRARYNLPLYSQHNALTDAIATAELLQAQIAFHYSKLTRISDIWV